MSAFATILHSRTLARATHSTKSPVRVGQVYPCRICRRAASLKDPARLGFCWPFRSLHAHLPEPQTPPCRPPPLQSVPLLYAARLLPFRRSLCPSCACLLLPVHRVVFRSCRRSFFDWATPVKLYSSVFCMLIDCLLHQFLGLIQERVRVRVSHRKHVVNELKQQVVDVRLCLSAISLTTCRLDDIFKEVLHFPGPLLRRLHLLPVASLSLASQQENPIRYLPPSFCGNPPLGLRLISACVRL